MQIKYTRHQVPRGSRPDAETMDKIYLIKNVATLRATYQLRILLFKAVEYHKKLVLKIPKTCQLHASIKELIKVNEKTIKREDL
jgi:hypothetical protein